MDCKGTHHTEVTSFEGQSGVTDAELSQLELADATKSEGGFGDGNGLVTYDEFNAFRNTPVRRMIQPREEWMSNHLRGLQATNSGISLRNCAKSHPKPLQEGDAPSSSSYNLRGARIDGNTLLVTVTRSGEDPNPFKLYWDGGWKKSVPPGVVLNLVFNRRDRSESMSTETLRFDLSQILEQGEVSIDVRGPGDQSINLHYEEPAEVETSTPNMQI